MADGRHLGKIENSPYLSLGLTDVDEMWHSAYACSSTLFEPLQISKRNFKNP